MDAKAKEDISNILQKVFELIVTSGAAVEPAEFIGELERTTSQTPDQFMALNNLERFLATTVNSASILSDLFKDKKLLLDFLMVVSTSEYLADILVRHPSYFRFLFSPLGIESQLNPAALKEELLRQISIYKDTTHKSDYVRRIYKREILRICARDICGRDDLENTTLQISQLAETILRVYFQITTEEFEEKRGVSPPPTSCIALGKFGGNELNYSSDIDLLFLFSEKDEEKSAEVSALANKFVSQLINHLTS
ncbi:MAG: hypothetical protein WAO19_13510, partial [Candidatus Kryptoniota bacterium]